MILITRLFKMYEQKNMTYIKPTDSELEYLVRDLPDKQKAADMLNKIKHKLHILSEHMKQEYPDDEEVQFLADHFDKDTTEFTESLPNAKTTSFNVNKGERLTFCIRQRNDKNEIIDENTITFVAIHELAHSMTKERGHPKPFWDNFKRLLQEAVKINLYRPQDFATTNKEYCGMEITNSPLFK